MVKTKLTNTVKSAKLPQMAVFDIDGTIRSQKAKRVSDEVMSGVRHLHALGVITTVCTGRPYIRLR